MNTSVIEIKPYSIRELAEMYGISVNTFKKWVKPYKSEIGLKIGHFYNARQVEFILGKFGYRHKVEI
jgi:transposase